MLQSPGAGHPASHPVTPPQAPCPSPSTSDQYIRYLEEKLSILQSQLAERDAFIQRLQQENLEGLREVGRARTEYERRYQQLVEAYSQELKVASPPAAAAPTSASSDRTPHHDPTPSSRGRSPATPPIKVIPKVSPRAPSTSRARSTSLAALKPAAQEAQVTHADSCPKSPPLYLGIGPRVPGEVFALFEGGFGYRIEHEGTWALYNDTPDCELAVQWRFGPGSSVAPLGGAIMTEERDQWTLLTQTVYPNETKPFMAGTANGWKSAYTLKPVSDEYRQCRTMECAINVKREMSEVMGLLPACHDSGEISQGKLLAACAESDVRFVDPAFPPEASSLSRPGVDVPPLDPLPWGRPATFLPSPSHCRDPALCETIDPRDIVPGALGDSWLMSALACLAEHPQLVRDVFPNGSVDTVSCDLVGERRMGGFRLLVCHGGWRRELVVDDYLPTLGGRPCFGSNRSSPSELWVALIEKAFAKMHGSYASIVSGTPLEALCDLTGLCGWNFTPSLQRAQADATVAADLFYKVLMWDQKGYLISLGTPSIEEDVPTAFPSDGTPGLFPSPRRGKCNKAELLRRYQSSGLVPGHSYPILAVRAFPQHSLHLVKFRNPWADAAEWTGEWSHTDGRWESMPDVAAACQFSNAIDDGAFWMSWPQALEYFHSGDVCARGPWNVELKAKGEFSASGIPSVAFEVTTASGDGSSTPAVITLSQRDRRGRAASDPDSITQAILLTVAQPLESKDGWYSNYRCSPCEDPFDVAEERIFSYSRDVSMQFLFQPTGHSYLVIPHMVPAPSSGRKSYVLTLRYSTHNRDANADPPIRVRCSKISSSAPPFRDYAEFLLSDCGLLPCPAECQLFLRDTGHLVCETVTDFTILVKPPGIALSPGLSSRSASPDKVGTTGARFHRSPPKNPRDPSEEAEAGYPHAVKHPQDFETED